MSEPIIVALLGFAGTLLGSLFGQEITDRPTPSNAVFPDSN